MYPRSRIKKLRLLTEEEKQKREEKMARKKKEYDATQPLVKWDYKENSRNIIVVEIDITKIGSSLIFLSKTKEVNISVSDPETDRIVENLKRKGLI